MNKIYGTEFEYDLFGGVKTHISDYRQTLEKYAKEGKDKKPYWTFKDAIEIAKKFQESDPLNPERPFARELRIEVANKLFGAETKEAIEKWDRVKFYSALKTPLDVLHGIDAFIEITGEDGRTEIVTLDATVNPRKKEERFYKADILITEEELPIGEDEFIKFIDQKAGEIREIYQLKLKEKETKLDRKPLMR